MSAPFLLDLSHTSHTRARTGIQRVARSLWREFGAAATPVTYDPHQRAWRALDPWELQNLATHSFGSKRSTSWPLTARIRGHTRRLLSPSPNSQLSALNSSALLIPELFTTTVGAALPALLATTTGPRAAIFHDAIALKFPELTPSKTVARFPVYLRELLSFDGIAAISDDSRDSLLDYWQWLGIPASAQPIVTTIPLGIDPVCHLIGDKLPAPPNSDSQLSALSSQLPALLSVGSIEGRKNHLALLDACESLWAAGTRFELHLIGLAHPQTGRTALARIQALQAAGRPLRYAGPASDADLAAAYAACAFTVYPSLIEGFGLPVLESLSRGKPCICSAHGALGESARGGGCLALDRMDAPSLAAAIARLLAAPNELTSLATAARARRFRTWSDYARDLSAWLATVPRRPTP
jgi:glycosyltransferase involved in cell wall biosynthesis